LKNNNVVVISDLQMPFHSKAALRNVISFIGDYQPSRVVQIGDLCDFPSPARWNKGTKGEFEDGVIKHTKDAEVEFCAALRGVYSGRIDVTEGNHDLRPREYLKKNAPALAESNAFDLDVLMSFKDYGIGFVRDFIDLNGGWTATHGHLGFSLSRYAGGTAINAARKINRSVVIGHTHRIGVIGESKGYAGKGSTLWGFEVGHLMDIRKAHYLKSGYGNWQMGFGVLEWNGKTYVPRPVFVNANGSFTFDGREYK